MEQGLYNLILKTKEPSASKHRNGDATHMIYYPQQQFITIKRANFEEFWYGYCDLVYKGDGNYSIAEINTRDMPVLALLTFKFNKDNIGDRDIFPDKFLYELIYAWQKAIDDRLYISESRRELYCIALESDMSYQEGNSMVFQVRLQFPFCRTDNNSVSRIREKAISVLRRRNSLKLLETTPENDWDKIVESQAHNEPLLLYKSDKVPNRPKLNITNVYDEITPEDIEKNKVKELDLGQTFDPSEHSLFKQGMTDPKILEETDNTDPLFWLPLILSINYSNLIVLNKEDTPVRANGNSSIDSFNDKSSILSKAEFFLQYVRKDRASNRFSWRDIGCALYTSSGGSEDALETWVSFTEQRDEFSREDCEAEWDKFINEKHITYRTIAWYAMQDSPEEYKIWHRGWCDEMLEKALELHHYNTAEWLYRRYWLELACSSADHGTWYVFISHRWVRRQKAVVLAEKIRSDAIPNLEQVRAELTNHVMTVSNKADKASDEFRIKALSTLIGKLSDYSYVRNVVGSSATYFHLEYENFDDYADNNPNLMGCNDCVIEADDKGIAIRDGKPEDYITMTTNQFLRRRRGYSWDHKDVKEVMEWLRKVHTDGVQREEFVKELSSWLRGRNIEKRVPFWTGGKNNSKSMIIRAVELAFGQYFGKFPTSIFTGRRTQSSSANPELARTKGKRVMVCQETDEDTESFRKGILKEFSGNDTMFARNLYSGGSEFLPMFKLCIVCNKIPRFVGSDEAIKERVRVVPFLSTWTSKAPDSTEEQEKTRHYKKDPHFEVKIPQLAPALLWIMIQKYPKYIEEGIRDPPAIVEYTEKYWHDQDYFTYYANECLKLYYTDESKTIPDESKYIKHTELYAHFKKWFLSSMPNNKDIPDSMGAEDKFKKVLPKYENKKWLGVQIIRDDDIIQG